jgi:D-xylose 1-dehydrogenase
LRTRAGCRSEPRLGQHHIRVNAIVPGWAMTDRQLAMWVDAEAERTIDANRCQPGRLEPEHISAMALFLAADDACMRTAQSWVVDAGWS